MWWRILGVKPASDASVLTAASSAVLREFTIHGRSAQVVRSGMPLRGASPAGTPRPHGVLHSDRTRCNGPGEEGARL